jgi:hypothetical protein
MNRHKLTLVATAHCLGAGCDWAAAGDWPDVDKAAERHTRQASHPTGTMARPATAAGNRRPWRDPTSPQVRAMKYSEKMGDTVRYGGVTTCDSALAKDLYPIRSLGIAAGDQMTTERAGYAD